MIRGATGSATECLTHAALGTPSWFGRPRAGMHVERESLVARQAAPLLVRAGLTLCGFPAPLELLEDVTLTITATDADGVQSVHSMPGFRLAAGQEVRATTLIVTGPIGYSLSYLTCRTGHLIPIWQPCIGSLLQ
jgi:hypothetical protein